MSAGPTAAAAGDEALVGEAIELALRGRGEVEPNPRVGALALQRGAVVGRGWHRFWGGPHAEVEALDDARRRGAAPDCVVTTLEPCSSEPGEGGKRHPPCARALLQAGVRRVVVGARDPFPGHCGRGLAMLAAAGVEVVEGVLEERCRALLHPFARWLRLERPWTIAKWAMTMDGKTAAASGESRWISGLPARAAVHQLRARVDAVVVGFRTAQRDDPELTVRHVVGPPPVRVVVDPRAELDGDRRLLASARQAPVWILVSAAASAERRRGLAARGAEVIAVPPAANGALHLAEAWRELRRRGIRRLLVEGGGGLLAALLEGGCVDQTLCFVAPVLLGGAGAATAVAGAGRSLAEAWRLGDVYWRACGEDLAVGGFVQ